jgi:3-hydroxybutyryl-CoA dehydrogenase
VLGLHFFNPVPVLPLVELVSTLVTSDVALEQTEQFGSSAVRQFGTGQAGQDI